MVWLLMKWCDIVDHLRIVANFFMGVVVVVMFIDRSSGRLGGLNNLESNGVSDAKNLRVKVTFGT